MPIRLSVHIRCHFPPRKLDPAIQRQLARLRHQHPPRPHSLARPFGNTERPPADVNLVLRGSHIRTLEREPPMFPGAGEHDLEAAAQRDGAVAAVALRKLTRISAAISVNFFAIATSSYPSASSDSVRPRPPPRRSGCPGRPASPKGGEPNFFGPLPVCLPTRMLSLVGGKQAGSAPQKSPRLPEQLPKLPRCQRPCGSKHSIVGAQITMATLPSACSGRSPTEPTVAPMPADTPHTDPLPDNPPHTPACPHSTSVSKRTKSKTRDPYARPPNTRPADTWRHSSPSPMSRRPPRPSARPA